MIDGDVMPAITLEKLSLTDYTVCYEVMRAEEGIYLFMEDHLLRLRDSLKKINRNYNIDSKYIIDILLELKIKNALRRGNAKLLVAFPPGSEKDPRVIAYQVKHRYPTADQYRKGVTATLYYVERKRPNVKYLDLAMQEKCKKEIEQCGVYEVLLVDRRGHLTEGSKSNVFFVSGGIVCTPPAHNVLKGITREKIIGICREYGYPLLEENIPAKDLDRFEAAFITGTSSKVLPLASIGAVSFSVVHPLIASIMERYDEKIGFYKKRILHAGYNLGM